MYILEPSRVLEHLFISVKDSQIIITFLGGDKTSKICSHKDTEINPTCKKDNNHTETLKKYKGIVNDDNEYSCDNEETDQSQRV